MNRPYNMSTDSAKRKAEWLIIVGSRIVQDISLYSRLGSPVIGMPLFKSVEDMIRYSRNRFLIEVEYYLQDLDKESMTWISSLTEKNGKLLLVMKETDDKLEELKEREIVHKGVLISVSKHDLMNVYKQICERIKTQLLPHNVSYEEAGPYIYRVYTALYHLNYKVEEMFLPKKGNWFVRLFKKLFAER